MTPSSEPAPGTGPQGKAAELLAAVRAVESGERPAASFFNQPAPRPAAKPRPAAVPSAPAGPTSVPQEIPSVLAEGGAPVSLAPRVAAALGDRAGQELREDPWRLLSVSGVLPAHTDSFARALLGGASGPDDPRRTQALTCWLLERAARSGHTALPAAAVRQGLAEHGVPDPDEAVRDAVDAGAVLVFQDPDSGAAEAGPGEEQPVTLLLGLDRHALAEESLADGLWRLYSTFAGARPDGGANTPPPVGPESGDVPGQSGSGRPSWAELAADAPVPSAAELISLVGAHGLVLHTGGEAARSEPAASVAAARRRGLRAWAVVDGEDSRRRLAGAAVEGSVITLAELLAGRGGPQRDGEGTLAVDLLAVLDAQRLDAEAAALVVESLPDGARLVLSGDPQALGAAGPGEVLADALNSRLFPHLASRTPDPGPVGELVSGIGIGELPQVEAPDKEIVIVPVFNPGEAVHRTVQLVAESIPRAFGLTGPEVQVICPGHGGAAGTAALNSALKEHLHPGPGQFGGFDPGDLVAHVPAPGQLTMATVAGADPSGLRLKRTGAGPEEAEWVVPRDLVADTVRHGWALTAHQAASSRWPAVVVVLPGDVGPALDRSWAYTAFGRGERHLSVVQGAGPALGRGIAERPASPRTTRLGALLGELAARGGEPGPGTPASERPG